MHFRFNKVVTSASHSDSLRMGQLQADSGVYVSNTRSGDGIVITTSEMVNSSCWISQKSIIFHVFTWSFICGNFHLWKALPKHSKPGFN